jgi:hypothetical protein
MVAIVGLDTFINYFKGYEDHYVLIGGAACSLWLEEQGLSFRSTKDLDVVIVVEGITDKFYKHFWRFIKDGQYKSLERSKGRPQLYRFQYPEADGFPYMIELLTRNILELPEAAHLTPIPVNDDISSLSAILLEDVYYKFVLRHRTPLKGATIIPARCLIPLKAKAWLDLTTRRTAGDQRVRANDIKKHRNDVFRLLVAMPPADRVSLPKLIRDDLATFLSSMPSEGDTWKSIEKAVLDTMGVVLPSRSESITLIGQIFGI